MNRLAIVVGSLYELTVKNESTRTGWSTTSGVSYEVRPVAVSKQAFLLLCRIKTALVHRSCFAFEGLIGPFIASVTTIMRNLAMERHTTTVTRLTHGLTSVQTGKYHTQTLDPR